MSPVISNLSCKNFYIILIILPLLNHYSSKYGCFKPPKAVRCSSVHSRRVKLHRYDAVLINGNDATVTRRQDTLHHLTNRLPEARAWPITNLKGKQTPQSARPEDERECNVGGCMSPGFYFITSGIGKTTSNHQLSPPTTNANVSPERPRREQRHDA